MAVETSSGPGWGGAPLGSAMVIVVVVVVVGEPGAGKERGHASSYRRQTRPNTNIIIIIFSFTSPPPRGPARDNRRLSPCLAAQTRRSSADTQNSARLGLTRRSFRVARRTRCPPRLPC